MPRVQTDASCGSAWQLPWVLGVIAAASILFGPVAVRAQEASARPSVQEQEVGAPADGGAEDAGDGDSEAPAAEAPAAAGSLPHQGIEEIVVTGERVVETEFDAPQSVTAFDAEELTGMGIEDVSDLAVFTPNLEIRTAGATSSTFFIRGVGLNDFTTNAAGAVAIYQDDVPLSLPAIQLAQLFDVRSVEVLRGPQATGPGRNASAGAIRIYTNEPTGQLSGFLRSEIGNYESLYFEGAAETPIVDDLLSTRLAFVVSERDPFLKNGCANLPPIGLDRVSDPTRRQQPGYCGETQKEQFPPKPAPAEYFISGVPAGLPAKLNNRNNWAARGQLRLTPPGSEMDWLFNVHGSEIQQLATLGQTIGTQGSIGDVNGFFGGKTLGYRQPEIEAEQDEIFDQLGGNDLPLQSDEREAVLAEAKRILSKRLAKRLDRKPYRGDYNLAGSEKQSNLGSSLKGGVDLGSMHLSSVTGYESYERKRESDADYTPNVVFENHGNDKGWQFSQDLGLEGELTDAAALQWNTGGYFLMDHIEFNQDQITGPAIPDLTRDYTQDTWSFGIYAGFLWDFLEDFSLEGGVRYNWEKKVFDVDLIRSGAQVCESDPSCHEGHIWDAPTGTLSLRYRFAEDLSVYAKYSHGWKGAQFNAGGSSGLKITVAQPEVLDAWEVGLSGSWLDGRLTAKGSLFYYDYQNYQVFVSRNDYQAPPQRIVVNADDAENLGAEIELALEPFQGLSVDTRFGWIESRFQNFAIETYRPVQIPGSPASVSVPVAIDYTGNRLPNTPEFKVSLSAQYVLDLGRYGSIVPRYDYAWTDDFYFDPSEGRGAPNLDGEIYMPKYAIGQKAYGLHNIRLAYRTPDDLMVQAEVAGWVRNLTGEVYKTLAFDASTAANLVGNLVGDPRTYGISVTINY